MTYGTIIILNGASSSGKTTLLKELQQGLDQPFLDAGIDKFLWMLPKAYLEQPLWSQVFEYTWPEDKNPAGLQIKSGPLGRQLISGMHHAVAALAATGNNVLLDHVLLEQEWLLECARLFGSLPAWLVGIRCPLEVLEQRERQRRDRTLGQARAQYEKVHAHAIYDLEVDTSQDGPAECAWQIIQKVQSGQPPGALKQILNIFDLPRFGSLLRV
jgi:chloramphenicol 3-O phosphotransferase